MKVSDSQIMDAIWRHQVSNLSKRVLMHYVGGAYGLCEKDDFWFRHCSATCTINRNDLGVDLGSGQLLKRLKMLFAAGKIQNLYEDREKLNHFYINGDAARNAFYAARTWWLYHGVPEGHDNGVSRTKKIDLPAFLDLQRQCADDLLLRFIVVHSQRAMRSINDEVHRK